MKEQEQDGEWRNQCAMMRDNDETNESGKEKKREFRGLGH